MTDNHKECAATPRVELEEYIMNPCTAKNEAEWWASREIKRLRHALHDIYEVYAGSEGIPEPVTCPEAYLLSLLQQMVEIAAEHK